MAIMTNSKTGETIDVDAMVRAWLAGEDGIGESVASLPVPVRRVVLTELGYDTPSHWALFGC